MTVPLCNHIKENGILCGSPAMRRSRFCYFHDADRKAHSRILQAARLRERARNAAPTVAQCRAIEFPDLDTPRGQQRALSSVIHSLWSGALDHDTARVLLNAIQMKVRGPELAIGMAADSQKLFAELTALLNSPTPGNVADHVAGNAAVHDYTPPPVK